MMTSPAIAHIAGLDYESQIIEFNVRPEPGTVPDVTLFKARKGEGSLVILDVQPDNQGAKMPNGQVYQWFKLQFSNGQTGWLRAHVLTIQGDCTRFGYGMLDEPCYAYRLMRVIAAAAPAPPAIAVGQRPDVPPVTQPTTPATPAIPVGHRPDTPLVQPTVPAAPAPVPVTPPPAAPDPDAPAQPRTGFISSPAGARMREQPVSGTEILIIPANDTVTVLEVQAVPGQQFRWVRLQYRDRTGWVREDLLTIGSAAPARGSDVGTFPDYTGTALYPVPMTRCRFVRGFQGRLPLHNGVDYGASTGEPMLAGPVGGLCVAVVECLKCNDPAKPSTLSQGLGLANSAVFGDSAWNFGYGHYVVVRYLHNQLPPTTRQALANMGKHNAHIYAMYAHLSRMDVRPGQAVTAGQVIGACGDTGNSSGPHLHLELRFSTSPNYPGWGRLSEDNLLDPLLMFQR